ncbi:MAG TPA: hypothetical protein DHU96_28865 [Actinobacteria bacterium]|nr:hypothetical protein [Actinomycetota bacterium]
MLALAGTVAFGCWIGYRRHWWSLVIASVAGALILVIAAEGAWIESFFVPVPGGSGGVGEAAVPFFLALIVLCLGSVATGLVLGTGASVGAVIRLLRARKR